MTDDSFLNLRGKEALVNIYYNTYITNLNHPPIFNNCHLSSVIIESVKIAHPARYRRKVIFEARKLRLRRLEITFRLNDAIKRGQNYACISSAEHEHLRCLKHQFVKFVLKIAPNRGAKFGVARKMLYLCIVKS